MLLLLLLLAVAVAVGSRRRRRRRRRRHRRLCVLLLLARRQRRAVHRADFAVGLVWCVGGWLVGWLVGWLWVRRFSLYTRRGRWEGVSQNGRRNCLRFRSLVGCGRLLNQSVDRSTDRSIPSTPTDQSIHPTESIHPMRATNAPAPGDTARPPPPSTPLHPPPPLQQQVPVAPPVLVVVVAAAAPPGSGRRAWP